MPLRAVGIPLSEQPNSFQYSIRDAERGEARIYYAEVVAFNTPLEMRHHGLCATRNDLHPQLSILH